VQEVPGSNLHSGKDFYVNLSFVLLFLCFYFLFCQNIIYSHFANPFKMLIYLVYLTYCKMCDRLKGYQDTDLASFIKYDVNENLTQHVSLCEVTITTAYRCTPSRSRAPDLWIRSPTLKRLIYPSMNTSHVYSHVVSPRTFA